MFEKKVPSGPVEKLRWEIEEIEAEDGILFLEAVRFIGGNGTTPVILEKLRDTIIQGEGFLELGQMFPEFQGIIYRLKEEINRGHVFSVDEIVQNYSSKDWLLRFRVVLPHIFTFLPEKGP